MKILIFTDSQGDFGSIYFDLGKHFHQKGEILNLLDWSYAYNNDTFQLVSEYYDYIVTSVSPNELQGLMNLGVPKEKIIGICHSSSELILLAQAGKTHLIEEIAGYAVVCEDIYKSSIDLGVKREPEILAVGVTCERYKLKPADRLDSVGYYSSLSLDNPHGIEIRRGELAKKAVDSAGIKFKNIQVASFQERPGLYGLFDAFISSSTREGSSLYALEAAAAGRLVISTSVGQSASRLSSLVIQVPIEKKKFLEETTQVLKFYADNPSAYKEMCLSSQSLCSQYDWSNLTSEWIDFFRNARR